MNKEQAIKAAQKAGEDWTGVAEYDYDHFPEYVYEQCLLFSKNKNILKGRKDWKQGWSPHFWNTDEGEFEMDYITHFMPLPAPPKIT